MERLSKQLRMPELVEENTRILNEFCGRLGLQLEMLETVLDRFSTLPSSLTPISSSSTFQTKSLDAQKPQLRQQRAKQTVKTPASEPPMVEHVASNPPVARSGERITISDVDEGEKPLQKGFKSGKTQEELATI